MINTGSRNCTSLNGSWNVIIDPADGGNYRQVWKEKKALSKTEFYEYSFEGGPELKVPVDFNSQLPELTYYEGTIWYKKSFQFQADKKKRQFIHFGAVNYLADIYLNSQLIGRHEGGFTPFQIEITGSLKEGMNSLIVKVNNKRQKDGIPGLGYDWFNYGGITRDVNLIETGESYIEDYFIQLKKNSADQIYGWLKINGSKLKQSICVSIPELGIKYKSTSDENGLAKIEFTAAISPWSPDNPKLYKVLIEAEQDTIIEEIGFRTIEARGTKIYLNGNVIFLKGVNIHEEAPLRSSKAVSDSDFRVLLNWAKELGCNLVRLAHYPHNEKMVRMAEKMGIMVWDEIPVYQNIEFSSAAVPAKISLMMREMIKRDKNRCAVITWSLSNETSPGLEGRNQCLIALAKECRMIDSTRLINSVFCSQGYNNNTFNLWDPLYEYFDVVSLNEYLGWYVPWQGPANEVKWKINFPDKPLIISEFGGEALFGNNSEPRDAASSWSEDYQEQIYKDQIEMFHTTPNLAGLCPWILVDFRSPVRMHPIYQAGWNRKGLISSTGKKKKAWYVMQKYYRDMKL